MAIFGRINDYAFVAAVSGTAVLRSIIVDLGLVATQRRSTFAEEQIHV